MSQQNNFVFSNPVEHVRLIPAIRCMPQMINPNRHTKKNFHELCDHIRRWGYTSAILVVENPDFDPFSEPINLAQNHRGAWSMQRLEDLGDPQELSKHFQYQVVDGQHRMMALLACKDLHERHNGMVPAMVLPKQSEADLMSLEIMQNMIRGEHDLYDVERMVLYLHEQGKDAEWMADHLHVEQTLVDRMLAHAGMSATAESDGCEPSWVPEDDPLWDALRDVYMVKEARAYLEDHGMPSKCGSMTPETALKKAVELGWDKEAAADWSSLEDDRDPITGRKRINGIRYSF